MMYLEKLEFYKILDIVSKFCITDLGKVLALQLRPSNQKDEVEKLLQETNEALIMSYRNNFPS